MRKTILCLANSYKHGGRCVAGVCLDDGVWIRLRGAAPDGSLNVSESVLDDGSEPRLLDLIEVELHYPIPTDAHPEDWQIAPVGWRLLQRPASTAQLQKVTAAADKGTTILRGASDRMPVEEIQSKPLQSSLVLVCRQRSIGGFAEKATSERTAPSSAATTSPTTSPSRTRAGWSD